MNDIDKTTPAGLEPLTRDTIYQYAADEARLIAAALEKEKECFDLDKKQRPSSPDRSLMDVAESAVENNSKEAINSVIDSVPSIADMAEKGAISSDKAKLAFRYAGVHRVTITDRASLEKLWAIHAAWVAENKKMSRNK